MLLQLYLLCRFDCLFIEKLEVVYSALWGQDLYTICIDFHLTFIRQATTRIIRHITFRAVLACYVVVGFNAAWKINLSEILARLLVNKHIHHHTQTLRLTPNESWFYAVSFPQFFVRNYNGSKNQKTFLQSALFLPTRNMQVIIFLVLKKVYDLGN